MRKAISKLEASLPVVSRPEFSSAVHWTPSQDLPIHRWFRYREGFSPQLLEFFPDTRNRLDPFCGCGTTLLESAKKGVQSYGVDLNPLATFVAAVKTKPYRQSDARDLRALARAAVENLPSITPAPLPPYSLLNKLFLKESIDTLLRIRSSIDQHPKRRVRDLSKLVWLSILEDSSNAFKEGNGLKYRNKQRRPGKYVTLSTKVWIKKHFGADVTEFVKSAWLAKSEMVARDIEATGSAVRAEPTIRTGSCLVPSNLDFGRPFDLVIFSPPYANRFDYFEAFKTELWMGGFVKASEQMAGLRRSSMRSNLAAERFVADDSNWSPLAPFLSAMDDSASSVRMGIKSALKGYFHDMRVLLDSLRPVVARKGKVVIVVGNSAYAKSIVPTDLLVAALGRECGYVVNSVNVARPLHVSSQQRASLKAFEGYMRESVVVLEKTA
jgi:site-specific DNA-methyltransferase (adenine-specific)